MLNTMAVKKLTSVAKLYLVNRHPPVDHQLTVPPPVLVTPWQGQWSGYRPLIHAKNYTVYIYLTKKEEKKSSSNIF